MLLYYYASSKRDAENLKSKLMRSKTNALMIVSNCSKSRSKKFKFVKFVYNQPADCVTCKKKCSFKTIPYRNIPIINNE